MAGVAPKDILLVPLGSMMLLSWYSSASLLPAPSWSSCPSTGHLNHQLPPIKEGLCDKSVTSELPGASEKGTEANWFRRGGVVVLGQESHRWGLGAAAPPLPRGLPASFPDPLALLSLHCRRPLQLLNHYPAHLLAGGSPPSPSLLRLLRRDAEAQHGRLHGRYGVWREDWKGSCLPRRLPQPWPLVVQPAGI